MSETITLGIRLPEKLKTTLEKHAAYHNRSLNAEIVSYLTDAVRPVSSSMDMVLETLSIEKVQRVRSTSTTADLGRMITLLRSLSVDQLILGARRDLLNNAVLVCVIQTPRLTLVIDSTSINMARRPREQETQALMREIHHLGLFSCTTFVPHYLPDTANLPVESALDTILSGGDLSPIGNLKSYLNLLSVHQIYDLAEYS